MPAGIMRKVKESARKVSGRFFVLVFQANLCNRLLLYYLLMGIINMPCLTAAAGIIHPILLLLQNS